MDVYDYMTLFSLIFRYRNILQKFIQKSIKINMVVFILALCERYKMPILSWLGREEALKTAKKTPYRLLEEVPELGYGDKNTENMIVQGDNLEALKALLPFYAGQVKCIYIDPPYNTGSRIDADGKEVGYDDNLEHSIWLSMMQPRLELLKEFLREDGCIFIQIDDEEQAYLKVLCDEVFGRNNFIANISCKVKAPSGVASNAQPFFDCSEYILCYSKTNTYDFETIKLDSYIVDQNAKKVISAYKFILEDINMNNLDLIATVENVKIFRVKEYNIVSINKNEQIKEIYYDKFDKIFQVAAMSGGKEKKVLNKILEQKNPNNCYIYQYIPSKGKNKGKLIQSIVYKKRNAIFLRDFAIKDKKNKHVIKQDIITNMINLDLWQGIAKEGNVKFKRGKKPEKLIQLCLSIFTKENDLVLDSFLGSGTTAAVAHKMGRRYIGIEMGNHAVTHCVPRLKAVINSEQGGISKSVKWQGGGGFRFYKLGNEVFDAEGNINENISFDNLSAHIWFTETKTPFNKPKKKSTYLGTHNDVSYALLYNGILRDKRVDGGNVLTSKTLNVILEDMQHQPYEKLVIYGESSRISQARLKSLNIEFKQTPYDIKAR